MRRFHLLMILFLPLLWSCTSNKVDDQSLIVAISSEPNTMDPRFATDANGMRLAGLLFNGLVKIGPDLEIVGDAASSWTLENQTYTFNLNPDLKFSNGRSITSEDISFSIDEFKKTSCPFHSAFTNIKNSSIEQVTKDQTTFFKVKLTLETYNAKFITSDLPVFKILPKKEVLELKDKFKDTLIGSGSYTLKDRSSQQIVLAANPYASEKASMKLLIFKIIKDDFTRYQKLLKGNIDIVQSDIPLDKVSEFEKRSSEFNIYKTPGLAMTYLLVNLKDPLLQEHKLRLAIARGINRSEIIQYKLEGYAKKATSILTPANPYFNSDLAEIEYDLDTAKKLIKELGLEGKVLTLKTSNNPSSIENGKVIAHQLNKIGLEIKLQSYEWGTFYGDVKNGNYQLATMRWVGAIDPDVYRIAFHSDELPPKGRNRGFYKNKNLDQLLNEGITISDDKKRKKLYLKIQKIVHQDLPIIPLWYNEQIDVVNKRVKNYVSSKNGDFSPFIHATK
ncbi:MAG: ABC transporter substrate-binding protein [Bdellovibrionales bacterium]|nr:ABC transporter substrate-binding protein [Bdellovibrionales bacterium]